MILKRTWVASRQYSRRRQWPRRLAQLLVLALVFYAGIGVGNGSINLPLPWSANSTNRQLPDQLDFTSANQVYRSLRDNYDGRLSEGQLIDGLKHGLAESTGDPYTAFFTPKEAKQFNDELNNSFSGIGAELGKDKEGNLQVIAPIAGTPAAKAGLQAQDLITAINGQNTVGIGIDEAVHKIRGPAGTKVTLQVVRNRERALTITITRQTITIPSVTTKMLPGKIGYIRISTFANDTAELTTKAASRFANQHVKGVILDLRNDPGGLLDAAVRVSSLWLPERQLILQEKRGHAVEQTYYSLGNNVLNGVPTVVLINSGSASASEITSGALHDNHRAYVIGEKSYGKGVVQQLINFGDGSQLKVTVASWYRPNGQNINKKGITPDKIVKLTETDAKNGNDVQLKAAENYLAAH